MFVEFNTSVGSRDAVRFGLDFTECTKGAVVKVDDKLGELLCSVDKATGITFAKPADAPKAVRAVAPEPEIKGVDDKGKK